MAGSIGLRKRRCPILVLVGWVWFSSLLPDQSRDANSDWRDSGFSSRRTLRSAFSPTRSGDSA